MHAELVSMLDTHNTSRASLVFGIGQKSGLLIIGSLEKLPANQQYQLWMSSDDDRLSGGVF